MATPLRAVRIPTEIWEPALARAKAEGRTLTDVIREYLAAYGRSADSDE